MTNDERVTAFKEAILKSAAKETKKIENNFDKKLNKALKIKKKEIETEYQLLYKKKCEEYSSQNSKNLSKTIDQKKIELMNKREEIKTYVFNKVINMINDYRANDAYKDYLKKSIDTVQNKCGKIAEIYISKSDLQIIQDITENIKINIDGNIKYGGIKFLMENNGIVIDDTLDERIFKEISNFSDYPELIID